MFQKLILNIFQATFRVVLRAFEDFSQLSGSLFLFLVENARIIYKLKTVCSKFVCVLDIFGAIKLYLWIYIIN